MSKEVSEEIMTKYRLKINFLKNRFEEKEMCWKEILRKLRWKL